MTPHRGEVWLVDFDMPMGREQGGRRPAVVVSADALNEGRADVIVVVPCTTRPRGLPTHIELEPSESGLAEVSYAKCEDVKSVSSLRLKGQLGAVPPPAMFEIARALRFLLDV